MAEVTPNSFSKEDNIATLLQNIKANTSKLNRDMLYELIKLTAPITTYKLRALTGYSYNSIKSAVKMFELANLIRYRIVLGDNNVVHKLICLSGEKDA